MIQESTLVDLEGGTELPAIFPGLFPEGAAIDRSGSPTGAQSLTLAESDARFGRVVAPADGSVSRITLSESTGIMGEVEVVNRRLEITVGSGFVRTTIEIMTFVPTGDIAPDGYVLVDGELCWSSDGLVCLGADGDSVITAGALAGAPSSLEGTVVTIQDGSRQIAVRAMSADAALAIANSLVRVDPEAP